MVYLNAVHVLNANHKDGMNKIIVTMISQQDIPYHS